MGELPAPPPWLASWCAAPLEMDSFEVETTITSGRAAVKARDILVAYPPQSVVTAAGLDGTPRFWIVWGYAVSRTTAAHDLLLCTSPGTYEDGPRHLLSAASATLYAVRGGLCGDAVAGILDGAEAGG